MGARDPWFDNAKMALVTLVVIGHSWVLLPDSALRDSAYVWLYAWHMPAFVVITGYLSRSFAWTGPRLWSLVRTVAVAYVLFEAAMSMFRTFVGGEQLEEIWSDPHWPMWFLVALFVWRLATPLFTAMPAPVALTVAVALSLTGGLWAGSVLDLSRVFGFLPFFVLGLHLRPGAWERLHAPAARVLGVAALLAVGAVTVLTDLVPASDWFYYSHTYAELDVTAGAGVALRSLALVLGVLGGAGFLALVPRRAGWWTAMGSASLVVYLFHGFFVKGALYAGWGGALEDVGATAALGLTTLAALGVALLLAWPPVARVLADVADPLGWAGRRVGAAHAVVSTPEPAETVQQVVLVDEHGKAAETGGDPDRTGSSLTGPGAH
ncbi:acyltransferase family protein [Nocardioides bruguierae]|uniref:Acyltransferase 3 domain-containing protein n=1 Tax=Nocardioides bruguierae TaxID=2945102 RepID=A0A9X2IDL0_9ACTN|nr:acyltransferase family protein [Nocardioides bruguierae]MCM0619372.1 hypothetical protein [Nocardioides bruguierae]